MKEAKSFISGLFKKKTMLICIFFAFLISIYPIVRANYNYIDDLSRVMYGYKGWENFSRYTSNFLSGIIHADSYLSDVSPLTQIIAVLFLALSCGILLYSFCGERISAWNIISVLLIGMNPYFLECISYKYDSPYMALSVLVSVIPLIFANCNKILYFCVSIVCMVLMCTTYQGASGIYPMAMILYCFDLWNKKENRKAIQTIGVSVLGYLSGLCIFKFFIMNTSIHLYSSGELLPVLKLIPGFFEHLYLYYRNILFDFKIEWIVLVVILMIGFLIQETMESRRKKYEAFLGSVVCLFTLAILMFGLYPALKSPIYNPRAMYGFGIFVTFIAMKASSIKKEYLLKIGCVSLTWCFFVFSFTYGNALSEQKRYTDFRIQLVLGDLNELECMNNENVKQVQICGDIGRSPVLENMPTDYMALERLVPTTFSGYGWGEYYFCEYFDIRNVQWVDETTRSDVGELPVLKDTMYHMIKGNDEYVQIILK